MLPACFENFQHFSIMSCSHEKRYQALPVFHIVSDGELGRGLGTRYMKDDHNLSAIHYITNVTFARFKVVCC